MRFMAGYGGCVLALAAQGICDDLHSDHKAGAPSQSSFDSLVGWLGIFAQQRLDDAPAKPPVQEFTATRILETIVTESHPRITEAPILRRKLGSNKWDKIHDEIQGRKRDATLCPSGYQLCPQSMNSGCCPTDRACGTDSCYLTSTGSASACGIAGYKECGTDQGGGCCPSDYICGAKECIPSTSVPNTETCGPRSYLCPASLNYGCCLKGMACGLNNCYSTSVQTFTITKKFKTTSSGHVKTLTSTSIERITPIPPSFATAVASSTPLSIIPKATSTPSAVHKVAATSPADGGLTKPQLDGIIAGAVILLVIILAVAFIILTRLNKVKKAFEASKSYRSYRTWSESGRSHEKPAKGPNMETVRGEMMAPSEPSEHVRHPSEPSAIHAMTHEMDSPVPHSGFPFSPDGPISPQYYKYTAGYAPVATSEPSSPPMRDHPIISPYTSPSVDSSSTFADLRDQNLRFGHLPTTPPAGAVSRPVQHDRQWSGDSNTSKFSQGSSAISESDRLDTSVAGSSSQRSFYGFKWIRGPKR